MQRKVHAQRPIRSLRDRGSREQGSMTGRNLVGRVIHSALLLLATVSASAAPGVRGEFNSYFETSDLASPTLRRASVALSCRVISDPPMLGFDLRFHSGYSATFRVKSLAAAGGWLQAVIRVIPAAPGGKAVFLEQRFTIPDVPVDAKGEVTFAGGFDLGPGRYRVDWMIRDANERVCSSRWDLEAKPARGEGDLPVYARAEFDLRRRTGCRRLRVSDPARPNSPALREDLAEPISPQGGR